MNLVRILERATVIRTFGIFLICAPFVNTYLYIISSPVFSESLTKELFFRLLFASPFLENIFSIVGLVLGVAMLSGSKRIWKVVMGYLGVYILNQVVHLGPNLRISWIHGLFFIGNILAFLFIADQLVWKQKRIRSENRGFKKNDQIVFPVKRDSETYPDSVASNVPKPVARNAVSEVSSREYYSKKPFPIVFEGYGYWANLIQISKKGVEIQAHRPPPSFIESKPLEIGLENDLFLNLRFSRKEGNRFYFEFVDLDKSATIKINSWLLKKAT